MSCDNVLQDADVQAPVRGCGLVGAVGRLDEVHGYVVLGKGVGQAEGCGFCFRELDDTRFMAADDG